MSTTSPKHQPATTSAGRPRLTVIGTGYLGATHAACMAELGYEVLGLDVDPAKIAALAAGRVPVLRARASSRAARASTSTAGRLRFTDLLRGGGGVRRRALRLRRHAAEDAASTPPT